MDLGGDVDYHDIADCIAYCKQGVLPAALGKVTSPEVKEFIQKCLIPAAERLSAKELLKDPFLQVEQYGETMFLTTTPDMISRSFTLFNYGPHFMDIDTEYVSTDGTPPTSALEFKRIHHNNEFRLRGHKDDNNSISLTLRIADDKGGGKHGQTQFLGVGN